MKGLTAFLLLTLLLLTTSYASETLPEDSAELVRTISVAEARALTGKQGVFFFDVRGDSYYSVGHLPGAVSVPYEWTTHGAITERKGKFDMSKLPADKSATIVFYGFGPTTLKSYKAYRAAGQALQAGYKDVLFLKSGYDEWAETAAVKEALGALAQGE